MIRKSTLLITLSAFIFTTLAAPWAQAGFWEERNRVAVQAGLTQSIWQQESKDDFARSAKSDNIKFASLSASSHQVFQQFPHIKTNPLHFTSSLSSSVKNNLPKNFMEKNRDILMSLPLQYGSIRKISVPHSSRANLSVANNSQSPVVIHIQDIHQNYEAQKNIGKAVQSLINNGGIGLLALEGAFEPIDLAGYRHFPDQETIRRVSDYLLRKNKISGPIHTAFTSQKDIPVVVGVDDIQHYKANVAAYVESHKKISGVHAQLSELKKDLEKEKSIAFGRELRAFDGQVQAYHDKTIRLSDYIKHLANTHATLKPEVEKFIQSLDMENGFDFEQVESERKKLVEQLVRQLSKEQTNELLNQSLAYRMGQVRYAHFYQYLQELCARSHISLNQYPSMNQYIHYVLISDKIDAEKLFQDIREMEKSGYALLAKTKKEKQLVTQSRQLCFAQKLVDFSLTPEEWEEYQETVHSVQSVAHNLPITDHQTPDTALNLSSFERFYKQAHARDQAISRNLIKEVNKHDSQVSILVTGGFHSPGITKRLQKQGYTIISFVPKIEKIDTAKGTSYLSVFTQEKTPLEKLFHGQKLFVPTHPLPRYAAFFQNLHITVQQLWIGNGKLSPRIKKALREIIPNINEFKQIIVQEKGDFILMARDGSRFLVKDKNGKHYFDPVELSPNPYVPMRIRVKAVFKEAYEILTSWPSIKKIYEFIVQGHQKQNTSALKILVRSLGYQRILQMTFLGVGLGLMLAFSFQTWEAFLVLPVMMGFLFYFFGHLIQIQLFQAQEAAGIKDKNAVFRSPVKAIVGASISFEAKVSGTAVGVLKINSDIEENSDALWESKDNEIVAAAFYPVKKEGFASPAGIVTATDTGNQCHAEVQARFWKIPHVVVENLDDISQFNGQWVYMKAEKNQTEFRLATQEEIENYQDYRQKPPKPELGHVDHNMKAKFLPFEQCHDPAQVSHKFASLHQLDELGVSVVKSGGVIPYAVYLKALESHPGLKDEIQAVIDGISKKDSRQSIEKKLEQAKKLIQGMEIPSEIWGEIEPHVQDGMFVRTGTNAEDLPDYPGFGAGRYSTYANVKKQDIQEAIKKCWASVWNIEAYVEREKLGVDHSAVCPAVQLAPAVPAAYSFVMHTADPIENNTDVVEIEIAQGFGEKLVGDDSVYAHRYVYSKSQDKIIKYQKGNQKEKAELNPSGGFDYIPVDYSQDIFAVEELNSVVALGLARKALKIEECFGRPMDIEGAIDANGQEFFVQARSQVNYGRYPERWENYFERRKTWAKDLIDKHRGELDKRYPFNFLFEVVKPLLAAESHLERLLRLFLALGEDGEKFAGKLLNMGRGSQTHKNFMKVVNQQLGADAKARLLSAAAIDFKNLTYEEITRFKNYSGYNVARIILNNTKQDLVELFSLISAKKLAYIVEEVMSFYQQSHTALQVEDMLISAEEFKLLVMQIYDKYSDDNKAMFKHALSSFVFSNLVTERDDALSITGQSETERTDAIGYDSIDKDALSQEEPAKGSSEIAAHMIPDAQIFRVFKIDVSHDLNSLLTKLQGRIGVIMSAVGNLSPEMQAIRSLLRRFNRNSKTQKELVENVTVILTQLLKIGHQKHVRETLEKSFLNMPEEEKEEENFLLFPLHAFLLIKTVLLNTLVPSVRFIESLRPSEAIGAALIGKGLKDAVELDHQVGDLDIITDGVALTLALQQVMENARVVCDYRNSKRVFSVTTKMSDSNQFVEIVFADTLEAVSKNVMKNIFNQDPPKNGISDFDEMGLAFAKQLIEDRCQGTLSVASHQGEGTVFTVRLPMRVSQNVVKEGEAQYYKGHFFQDKVYALAQMVQDDCQDLPLTEGENKLAYLRMIRAFLMTEPEASSMDIRNSVGAELLRMSEKSDQDVKTIIRDLKQHAVRQKVELVKKAFIEKHGNEFPVDVSEDLDIFSAYASLVPNMNVKVLAEYIESEIAEFDFMDSPENVLTELYAHVMKKKESVLLKRVLQHNSDLIFEPMPITGQKFAYPSGYEAMIKMFLTAMSSADVDDVLELINTQLEQLRLKGGLKGMQKVEELQDIAFDKKEKAVREIVMKNNAQMFLNHQDEIDGFNSMIRTFIEAWPFKDIDFIAQYITKHIKYFQSSEMLLTRIVTRLQGLALAKKIIAVENILYQGKCLARFKEPSAVVRMIRLIIEERPDVYASDLADLIKQQIELYLEDKDKTKLYELDDFMDEAIKNILSGISSKDTLANRSDQGGQWWWLDGLYKWLKSYVLAPALIESGLFVGLGSIITAILLDVPMAMGPPMWCIVVVFQFLWHIVHGKKAFDTNKVFITLLTLPGLIFLSQFDLTPFVFGAFFAINLMVPHGAVNQFVVNKNLNSKGINKKADRQAEVVAEMMKGNRKIDFHDPVVQSLMVPLEMYSVDDLEGGYFDKGLMNQAMINGITNLVHASPHNDAFWLALEGKIKNKGIAIGSQEQVMDVLERFFSQGQVVYSDYEQMKTHLEWMKLQGKKPLMEIAVNERNLEDVITLVKDNKNEHGLLFLLVPNHPEIEKDLRNALLGIKTIHIEPAYPILSAHEVDMEILNHVLKNWLKLSSGTDPQIWRERFTITLVLPKGHRPSFSSLQKLRHNDPLYDAFILLLGAFPVAVPIKKYKNILDFAKRVAQFA